MNDLVKFRIPAEFILVRALPTVAELVYGYDHGWVEEADVLSIAKAICAARDQAGGPVEELARLLVDELAQVSGLMTKMREGCGRVDDPAALWLYLALAWVHESSTEFQEPFQVVEMLYADFHYPSAIEGFVRFLPAAPGEPTGLTVLAERWRAYLTSEAARFAARRLAPTPPACPPAGHGQN